MSNNLDERASIVMKKEIEKFKQQWSSENIQNQTTSEINYDEKAKIAMSKAIDDFKKTHTEPQKEQDISSGDKVDQESDDEKENHYTVESAQDFYSKGQYEIALSLFKKSLNICERLNFTDGVRYAKEMIQKCNENM
ncbi:MAG: hypothetical protein GF364_05970 [Candidatus Lokiarchaeota archaeon]|nr:hypothetical protein [Candidatus Lokiarchaeota archaeon]